MDDQSAVTQSGRQRIPRIGAAIMTALMLVSAMALLRARTGGNMVGTSMNGFEVKDDKDAGACDADSESCACKQERASNFCTTCESFGGAGCGSCTGWCEDNFWKTADLPDLCSWQSSGPVATSAAACLCFWWRDVNYCSTCPGYGGTDCGPCDSWCWAGHDFDECDKPASCSCALKRDPNFCKSGIPEKCTEFCNLQDNA